MAVSYYTPGAGADLGIVLSNGGGSCPYNYLFANQMAGEQAGPTINCTITATVTGVSVGPHNTSVEADGLTFVGATFDGYSATAPANIAVVANPPSISAKFAHPKVDVGHTDTLSFEIDNPSGNGTLTGVGFSLTLPASLSVASSSASECGGTFRSIAPDTISLAEASIDSGQQCTVEVDVIGGTPGPQNITTSDVTSDQSGSGQAGSTSVTVVSSPSPTVTPTTTPTVTPTPTPTVSPAVTPPITSSVEPDGGVGDTGAADIVLAALLAVLAAAAVAERRRT
jgi:hypothetical protein